MVNPCASLSLQMHHHRAEHWIVACGTAEVSHGDTVSLLTEKQSTCIPLANTVMQGVGFNGRIVYGSSKPDGTPQKLLNVSRLAALGGATAQRCKPAFARPMLLTLRAEKG